jgi:DNA-binding NarL/FixJ family response regulator
VAAAPVSALASSTASGPTLKNPAVMQDVRIRLVLADELTLLREGLAAICHLSPRCEVIGQCADGAAALRLIQELRPEIAVLDIHLPGLHTIEVIRQVRAAGLPTSIAVLSARGDRKTVLEALRGGASAFLLKSDPGRHLVESFEHILDGAVYLSPLLNLDQIFLSAAKPAPEDPFDALSPREFQVFSLLVEGVRAKEIAARLCLSPKTVDTYRSSMMEKLEIYDIAGLVKYALQRDFISRG